MALTCEKGTWTGSGSSPQTITLTDSGLTPKAIIAWTTGPGSAGSFSANSIFSIGFGTRRGGSTQSGCTSVINIDNVAASDNARFRGTALLRVLSSTSTSDYEVSLSNFSTGSFEITYSNASNANGDIFHYLVFGGNDISDANIVTWQMESTSGSEVITGAGFQPDVMFCLLGSSISSLLANTLFSFGVASGNTKYVSFALTADDGQTMSSAMNWNKSFRTDACLEELTIDANTASSRYDLNSFDSDGVTLGLVQAPAVNPLSAGIFLFLKGGQWEAGSKAKATGTGNDTFTLANSGLTPKGIITFTTHQTAVGITTGNIDFCIGAGSSPSTTRGSAVNGVAGCTGPEAINTQADRFHATDAVIEELTGGATPAETSEAWFDSVAAGSFTLDWATNGGSAALIGYLAFGDNLSIQNAEYPPPLSGLRRRTFSLGR